QNLVTVGGAPAQKKQSPLSLFPVRSFPIQQGTKDFVQSAVPGFGKLRFIIVLIAGDSNVPEIFHQKMGAGTVRGGGQEKKKPGQVLAAVKNIIIVIPVFL